jgi:hypothetical protein
MIRNKYADIQDNTVQFPTSYTRTASAVQIATATVTASSSGQGDKDAVWISIFR